MLRLPVLPVTERAVTLPAGALAVNTVRWALTDPRHPREDLRQEWRRLNPV